MIGYVQDREFSYWRSELDAWIDGLVAAAVPGWSAGDRLGLAAHDGATRVASLRSTHRRVACLEPILIDHLWIEM
jgi:hypothetical protein